MACAASGRLHAARLGKGAGLNRPLPDMMRDLVHPEVVVPTHWEKTFEAYGWTADMVQSARDAEIERRLRNMPEVAADD